MFVDEIQHNLRRQDTMSSGIQVNMSSPVPKKAKPPPLGVERSVKASLFDVLRLDGCQCSERKEDQLDQFFQKPLESEVAWMEPANIHFSVNPTGKSFIIGVCLSSSRRKRPMASWIDMSTQQSNILSTPRFVITIRGNRSQTESRFFKVKMDMLGALASYVFISEPEHPCNFHPWFSSIVTSLSTQMKTTETRALVGSVRDDVKKAFKAGEVYVEVCVPNCSQTEHILHNLAIDRPVNLLTKSIVQGHEKEWLCASKAITTYPDVNDLYKLFNNVTSAIQAAKQASLGGFDIAAVQNVVASKLNPMKYDAMKLEDDVDGDTLSEKKMLSAANDGHSSTVPNAKNAVEQNDPRRASQGTSGASKFISKVKESSSVEDKHEKCMEKKFQSKMIKYDDSDASESEKDSSNEDEDSGQQEKKKKKKRQIHSDAESSLDDDSDDDESDDDDSDDDDSDDDDSDDDDSDDDELDSTSEEEGEERPAKKKRLVKGSQLTESSGSKFTQTKLKLGGSPTAAAPKRKGIAPSENTNAQSKRQSVTVACKNLLDSVESCNAIPTAEMPKITKVISDLRPAFTDDAMSKFPVNRTYSLKRTFDLAENLVKILNDNIPTEQRNKDNEDTRRIAVSTTSALLKLVPAIENIKHSMEKIESAHAAVTEFEKITKDIVNDISNSTFNVMETY